ncbi:MAG: T9SS type A sorting domain-containing protein [Candidatus Eisenbacteria bacterium]|nr:T9SS type A sorting domain-containing protein [Candidatus Eisenbacteria bacterium]
MESGTIDEARSRNAGWPAALIVLLPLALALAPCCDARADVTALWSPPAVTVSPGEEFELNFRAGPGEDLIASFQLYISYDPSVIDLVAATEGSLYTESGFMTWFIDEEEYPGFWHFFDTVFGAGTYVTPPGELLHLRFQALQCGYTQAHVDTLRFTDQGRDPLAVESFQHANIFVVPSTGVEAPDPGVSVGPGHPNPFIEETSISFAIDSTIRAASTLEIYDISGRLVRSIGIPDREAAGTLVWDGRDDAGRDLPASVYFVRLRSGAHDARTRIVKMR